MFPNQAVKARGALEGVNIPFKLITSRMVAVLCPCGWCLGCSLAFRRGCEWMRCGGAAAERVVLGVEVVVGQPAVYLVRELAMALVLAWWVA